MALVDPREVLHDLDDVIHAHGHLHPAGVGLLEAGDHLGHGGAVQVQERLDDVAVDESLAGLVLLVTGKCPPDAEEGEIRCQIGLARKSGC